MLSTDLAVPFESVDCELCSYFPGVEKERRPERKPRTEYDRDKPREFRDRKPAGKVERQSHEVGMVRLKMDIGKVQGIRPADVVGAIAFHADIPGG